MKWSNVGIYNAERAVESEDWYRGPHNVKLQSSYQSGTNPIGFQGNDSTAPLSSHYICSHSLRC